MSTLIELLRLAQHVEYYPPEGHIDDWSYEEILHASIKDCLNSTPQLKASLSICNNFPPLKIFYKSNLKTYIKKYGSEKN